MESNILSTSRVECFREDVLDIVPRRTLAIINIPPNHRFVFRGIYACALNDSEILSYDMNLAIRDNNTTGPYLSMFRGSPLVSGIKIEPTDGLVFHGGRRLIFQGSAGTNSTRIYLTLVYDDIKIG